MKATFDRRIARALELSLRYPAAAELLSFYRELALFQKPIFAELQSKGETDMRALQHHFPALIQLVQRIAPRPLKVDPDSDAQTKLLVSTWEGHGVNDADSRFYARVLLQPYAEYLASRGDVQVHAVGPTCPFCNAMPVAGVLRGEGDGAKKWLLCSLCSTEWQFRRVLCPGCGEEDKNRLPIYTAPEFGAVRVDACDTCRTYLKSIDLTKDGHAVPIVDELATIALNIWVEENHYVKLEMNLLGM